MARIASFLPRLTFRHMAQQAYRLAMTRGKFVSVENRNGLAYTMNVDVELDCVFIGWTDSEYGQKVSVHPIQKGW